MVDEAKVLASLSGQTKALIIVNEFLTDSQDVTTLKNTLSLLVASDLERVGIMELIKQELAQRGTGDAQRDQLIDGLSGVSIPSDGQTTTRQTPPGSVKITGIKRKTNAIPKPGNAKAAAHQPPPPPKLYPGQGARAARRTSFVPRAPTPATAPTQEVKQPDGAYFGDGAGSVRGLGFETKPTILIADDDPRIRMIFRMKLEKAGYQIIEAGSGDLAWQLIEEKHPSGAVIDMKMPGLHGLEVLARCLSAGGQLPIIVCSAYDQLRDEMVVATYPNLRYFVKPVDAQEMLAALTEMVPLPT